MQAIRRRDTSPELAIRRELFRRGQRYRVDIAPVAGLSRRADIVFPKAKVAVFVDGCFWHGCTEHRSPPRTNAAYWEEKIATNRTRDAETTAALRALGWVVLRFWEHDLPARAAEEIATTVAARRVPGSD